VSVQALPQQVELNSRNVSTRWASATTGLVGLTSPSDMIDVSWLCFSLAVIVKGDGEERSMEQSASCGVALVLWSGRSPYYKE
jgi:hypothetical protein